MLKTYTKPIFKKQAAGPANKMGGAAIRRVLSEIDRVPVSELIQAHGSPLFVFSEKTIKRKHRELSDAFTTRYPNFRHAWSYKTNYFQAICRTFHQLGSWAEVVSMMEYEMATRLGVPPSQIVYNGPTKKKDELRRALSDGARVNIDSLDELADVEKVAQELGRVLPLGIRFNMSLGTQMSWDRYGFNIESGMARDAIKRAVTGGRVRIAGFHAHIGTFMYEPDNYRIAVKKLIEFHKAMREEFGIQIEYLDLGGGFASRNRLKGTYLSTLDLAPAFDRYAEAICEPLIEAFPAEELPLLILETGRAMIDEAGSLLATVTATKRLASGKRGLVLDAGVNLIPITYWYDYDVIPARDRGFAEEEHVVYGPLCMQIDCLKEHTRLPHLENGDPVVIRPVGAYNTTQWMQFITLRPAVVMISERGEVGLIREPETVDYLQQVEKVPSWIGDKP